MDDGQYRSEQRNPEQANSDHTEKGIIVSCTLAGDGETGPIRKRKHTSTSEQPEKKQKDDDVVYGGQEPTEKQEYKHQEADRHDMPASQGQCGMSYTWCIACA